MHCNFFAKRPGCLLNAGEQMLKILVAAALFWSCAMPAVASALSEETPAEFANLFYRTYGTLRIHGIPNQKQLRALAPFLSSGLLRLFTQADRWQHPAENKPGASPTRSRHAPSGCDGDFFTSNSRGCATTYAIAFPHAALGRLIVPIHLADGERTWVDELVLHHRDRSWMIAEIVFTHDQSNGLYGKGTLRQTLRQCIRQMKKAVARGDTKPASSPSFPN